ncbi:PREDICTED: coiled-coil domain-containing protein 13 [Nanorana parkeri]|uniref:coiled-coil domain-containing protein 13 n=1 Tax=Nanorana parkeri TaxID=125878 RepID=UPI000854AD10|nr:PREDICTED: coiled-coil domain-containing protein 13 [Nanorana parkeri]
MESDAAINENLRQQFKTLQEQQQKRLQRLMERKKEKQSGQEQKKADAFGVQDQLDLFRLDRESSGDLGKRILEDENERLQGQARELQDENGRLHKLLREKEFEIRHLRRKVEDDKVALAGNHQPCECVSFDLIRDYTHLRSSDKMSERSLAGTNIFSLASSRNESIVELSKRNRELSAELESEKTKVRQLNSRVKELERELHTTTAKFAQDPEKDSRNGPNAIWSMEVTPAESSEMKALQDKLAAANLKLSEYRNQIQTTKQELKMAHKVLVNEVGEDVNIPQLITSSGSWRGRAQMILALQGRVRELETQLGQIRSPTSELSLEEEMMGTSRRLPAQEKNLFRLRTLEKEKKETLERLTGEHDTVKKEHEDLKKKFEASKARNRSLSNDLKTLKLQMTTLLEKGKHDDELIDALLIQQKNMQEILANLTKMEQKHQDSQHSLGVHLNNENQKQNSLVTQLKQMVAEREAKVKDLEEEIQQLTTKSSPKRPSSMKTLAEVSHNGIGMDHRLSVRSLSDSSGHMGSARTVSKLGHELVETVAAPPPVIGMASSSGSSELRAQYAEYRALCQAAEVERDRLMELVSVLQRRVEENNMKALEAEKKLQEERRRSVHLEQQLERIKMDAAKNGATQKMSARGKAGQSLSNSRLFRNFNESSDLSSNVPLETQLEELSTKLEIKVEENEALKSALKSALKTKEDDLKLYNEMMVQVKQIFLQALRQHKQERGAL